MTRDAAIAAARLGLADTTFPHMIGMDASGDWHVTPLTGKRLGSWPPHTATPDQQDEVYAQLDAWQERDEATR